MEYSRTGSVIKGQEKAAVKSRYEEDVLNNNHTVRQTDCHCTENNEKVKSLYNLYRILRKYLHLHFKPKG